LASESAERSVWKTVMRPSSTPAFIAVHTTFVSPTLSTWRAAARPQLGRNLEQPRSADLLQRWAQVQRHARTWLSTREREQV